MRKCLTVGELEDCLALLKDKSIPIHIFTKGCVEEFEVLGIIFQELPEGEKPSAYYIQAGYSE